jgi:hypothetical protein
MIASSLNAGTALDPPSMSDWDRSGPDNVQVEDVMVAPRGSSLVSLTPNGSLGRARDP